MPYINEEHKDALRKEFGKVKYNKKTRDKLTDEFDHDFSDVVGYSKSGTKISGFQLHHINVLEDSHDNSLENLVYIPTIVHHQIKGKEKDFPTRESVLEFSRERSQNFKTMDKADFKEMNDKKAAERLEVYLAEKDEWRKRSEGQFSRTMETRRAAIKDGKSNETKMSNLHRYTVLKDMPDLYIKEFDGEKLSITYKNEMSEEQSQELQNKMLSNVEALDKWYDKKGKEFDTSIFSEKDIKKFAESSFLCYNSNEKEVIQMKTIKYTDRNTLDENFRDDLYYKMAEDKELNDHKRASWYGLVNSEDLDKYNDLLDNKELDNETREGLKQIAEDEYFKINDGNKTFKTQYSLDSSKITDNHLEDVEESFADLKSETNLQKSLEVLSHSKGSVELYNPYYDLSVQKFDSEMLLTSSDQQAANAMNVNVNDSVFNNDINISNIKEIEAYVEEDSATPKNLFKANGLDIVDFYEENKELSNKDFVERTIEKIETFENDEVKPFINEFINSVDDKKKEINEFVPGISENDLDKKAFEDVKSEISVDRNSIEYYAIPQIEIDLNNGKTFEDIKEFVESKSKDENEIEQNQSVSRKKELERKHFDKSLETFNDPNSTSEEQIDALRQMSVLENDKSNRYYEDEGKLVFKENQWSADAVEKEMADMFDTYKGLVDNGRTETNVYMDEQAVGHHLAGEGFEVIRDERDKFDANYKEENYLDYKELDNRISLAESTLENQEIDYNDIESIQEFEDVKLFLEQEQEKQQKLDITYPDFKERLAEEKEAKENEVENVNEEVQETEVIFKKKEKELER